jgi:hypothetical protein
MILKYLALVALLGGIAVGNSSTVTNNIGQGNSFYLGFYAADEVSTRSVIVNLGTSADVFSGISLIQSGLSSVLSTTYGSGWHANSQVFWSAFGYNGSYGDYGNMFAARDAGQPILQTSVMGDTALNDDQYWAYSDAIATVLTEHTSGGAVLSYVTGSTGHQHQFSVMENSATTFSGKADTAWGTFTSPVYAQVTKNLNVQEFAYDGSTLFNTLQSGPSTTVSIQTTDGVISVVPEPSTYALLGFGGLLLLIAYRRKSA